MEYTNDGRIVKATLSNCAEDMTNYICSHLKRCVASSVFISGSTLHDIVNHYVVNMAKNEYVGTAVCSDRDSFNEEKGRAIARARALRKYYKAAQRVLKQMLEDIHDMTHCLAAAQQRTNTREVYYGFADKLADNPNYLAKADTFHKIANEVSGGWWF